MRPERPREPKLDKTEDGEQSSRGPTGRFGLLCFLPQGIGLRPQPWAGLSRPVGPVLIGALKELGLGPLNWPVGEDLTGQAGRITHDGVTEHRARLLGLGSSLGIVS